MSSKCPSCGSDNIVYDSSRGEYTCSCGRVLQENTVVSDLAFTESAVVGKFGSQSGDYSQIKTLLGYSSNNAKEMRRLKVYKQIQQIASQLNLTHYHIEAAKRLYNMAQERNFELGNDKNFTQGRPTAHVIAAALYTICRLEKTPHLLIDFSDILQINLYVLGACYLKFVKHLHLDLPLVDPSLFIHRFCAKMEFGDKTHLVSVTALRLLQRMKRDWMTYGRRPNSLCGSAILIAARYHGFKRTTTQIVNAVHTSDETIRKRLDEFKKTTVASLTREEFENIDLENDIKEELDPPSFKKALQSQEYKQIENYENELRREAEMIEFQLLKEEEKPGEKATQDLPETAANTQEVAVYERPKEIALPQYKNTIDNYNETLSDIDEDEVSQFILTPEESHLKSVLWHFVNKDWIEEQQLKQEIMGDKKEPVKKRGQRKQKEVLDCLTPIEAMTKSSKLGQRVNLDVLPNLFDGINGINTVKKIKTV